MTFSIFRQWRFERYCDLKLGYRQISLVKTFCFPFPWPIRNTVPKNYRESDESVLIVIENKVQFSIHLNHQVFINSHISKLMLSVLLTHPGEVSAEISRRTSLISAPSRCTAVHSHDPWRRRWTRPGLVVGSETRCVLTVHRVISLVIWYRDI